MMANLEEPPDATTGRSIDAALDLLKNSKDDAGPYLLPLLDIAIRLTDADMGTLQRFDDETDTLELVASRGFPRDALSYFDVVRRDTNTSCAAAFTRRMRVFVEDIANSYLFVGTRELDMLRANGVSAVQSTPLISSTGRFWGVLSTHFRETQRESAFDHAPLDRLAVQIADSLEQRNGLTSSKRNA